MLTWAVCWFLARNAKSTGMAADGAGCVLVITAFFDVIIILSILDAIVILTGHQV